MFFHVINLQGLPHHNAEEISCLTYFLFPLAALSVLPTHFPSLSCNQNSLQLLCPTKIQHKPPKPVCNLKFQKP